MPAGVVDGEPVDQEITNAAFLYKNANDTSSGVYTLNAATSGPQINDLQNSVNVLLSGVGGSQSNPATAYSGVPGSTISNGDTHLTALIKLADKFFGAASAGGHTHSGTDGQGAPVIAVTSLAASGSSPITGAVTLSQGSFIDFVQSGQNIQVNVISPGLPDVLAVSNSATAGINFNGGAIAGLSYCDWYEAGFPPGYPASGHVYMAASADNHFYARTSASATRRVDATVAAYGYTAAYGDVVIAASGGAAVSQVGQTITIYAPTGGGGGGGGAAVSVLTKTAGYSIQTSDLAGYYLMVESNAATACTMTLPAASSVSGCEVYVINIGTAICTVSTNGTDTFGSTTDTAWTLVPGGSPQASNLFISNGGSRWNGF